jgi:hypothetical protein
VDLLARGPVASTDVVRRGKAAGVKYGALYRAALRLGVEFSRDRQGRGVWTPGDKFSLVIRKIDGRWVSA